MSYTISELAVLTGITPRTLRYYHQIGLLNPSSINKAGYRIYGDNEIKLLQHILFLKELDLPLQDIKNIVHQPTDNYSDLFEQHLQKLIQKRNHLDSVIILIEKTIQEQKGEIHLTDQQKFEAFKQHIIQENDEKYGNELKQKYKKEHLKKSNQAMANMTESDYQTFTETESLLIKALQIKVDIPSTESENIFHLHKKWLTMAWGFYQIDMHRGLVETYLSDEAFTSYYDSQAGSGATSILCRVIEFYTNR